MNWNPLTWNRSSNGNGLTLARQEPGVIYPHISTDRTIRAADAPGASKGILARIRSLFGGWVGPTLADKTEAGLDLRRERVHSGPAGVVMPAFLPYFLDVTGETAQMRLAYRKMTAMPEVKAALYGKILSVASLELKIHPADKRNPYDKKVADFIKWNITERMTGGFPGLVWSILSGGLIDGLSVNEKVWTREEKGKHSGLWPLRALKPKDVGNDIVPLTDSFRNIIGIRGLRYNAGETFDPADFVIFRNLPLYDSPVGTSDLRAAYLAYWMLDTAWKLRGIALEKRSMPFIWGTFANPAQQKSLDATLANVKWQNWSSVPEGVKLEVLNIAGSADAVFKAATDDLTERIFLGIQGATLQALLGGAGEQRGNSKVHKSTSDVFKWALAAALEHCLNDRDTGLIRDIVDLNFVVEEYPRATLSAVDVGEMSDEADLDKKLFDMGLPLSKEEAYEKYGRTPPSSPDDALEPPKPPPGMGGPPGTPPGAPGEEPPGGGLPPVEPTPDEDQASPGDGTGPEDHADQFAEDHAQPGESFPSADLLAEYAQAFAEGQERAIGDVWKGATGKRWYTRRADGRVVPAADPGKVKPEPKERKAPIDPAARAAAKAQARGEAKVAKAETKRKTGAAQVADVVDKAMSGRFKDAGEMADSLNALTKNQILAIKEQLGLSGPRSGVKAALAKRLAEEVLGGKKAVPASAPAAPAPPKPAPTAPAAPSKTPDEKAAELKKSANASGDVHTDAVFKKTSEQEATDTLAAIKENMKAHGKTDKSDIEDDFVSGRGKPQEVAISDLKSTQDWVNVDRALGIVRGEARKLGGKDALDSKDRDTWPKVVRYKGELYVFDGHTRATAASLAGRTKVNVNVIDLDEPKSAKMAEPASTQAKPGDYVLAAIAYLLDAPRDAAGNYVDPETVSREAQAICARARQKPAEERFAEDAQGHEHDAKGQFAAKGAGGKAEHLSPLDRRARSRLLADEGKHGIREIQRHLGHPMTGRKSDLLDALEKGGGSVADTLNPPDKRGTPPPSSSAGQHSAKVTAAVKALAAKHGDLIHLADLAEATGLSPADLHAAVQDLRRKGVLTATPAEGRHGVSDRDRSHGIQEGEQLLAYVSPRQAFAEEKGGQFAKGGGRVAGKGEEGKSDKPAAKLPSPDAPSASARGPTSSTRERVGKLLDAGKQIASTAYAVPKAVLARLLAHVPESVQAPVANLWHAVHGVLMAGNSATQALAQQVSKGKGLDEAQQASLAKTLGAIDLAFQGGMMATAAGSVAVAPGLAAAAKLASYCPVASVAYILGSSASPKGAVNTARSALTLLKERFPEKIHGAAEFAWGAISHPLTRGEAAKHMERFAEDPESARLIADAYAKAADKDWWLACFSVAFDDVGDVAEAIEMADALADDAPEAFAEDASGHEHKGPGPGGGQFTGKGGGGGKSKSKKADKPERKKPAAEPAPKETPTERDERIGKVVPAETHAAVIEKAKAKLASVVPPTEQEKAEAIAGLEKLGANKYRRNLVGNNQDRRKRREKLLKEFGDGKVCPCIYCGITIGDGTDTLEQDKIVTTAQGGRYRPYNLVPACKPCNGRRGDMPFEEAIEKVTKYAGTATAS